MKWRKWSFFESDEVTGDFSGIAKEFVEHGALIEAEKEIARLGAEVEDLMRMDYWQDCYNIAVKERNEALAKIETQTANVNKCNAENVRFREALEEILHRGNLAMQGKWDDTTTMKDIAYQALAAFEAEFAKEGNC